MKLDDFDLSLIIDINQDELLSLPTSIVNCYNNLCKYTKPDSTDVGIGYENYDNKVEFFVTLISDLHNNYTIRYTEGEDFELTADERTAVITMMMETVTKSILATA